jgi:flagellar hook protein FlgE
MDPISAARYGMLSATRRFEASAERVARMGDENSDVDLGRETIEQLTASNQFVASAEIVRIADRMWDALLDVQSHGRR